VVKINPAWPTFWTLCTVAAVVAAVGATRRPSKKWLYVGRGAVGGLFILGGALMHAINLASGSDYSGFADPSHFGWITGTWRSVVGPNQVALISLLAAFEAVVGVLVVYGGRWTQIGLVAALGFHVCLWIFGWIETVYCLVMIPTLVLLLLAERRVANQRPAPDDSDKATPASVSSLVRAG
jgi:uncharacterized membrane protein